MANHYLYWRLRGYLTRSACSEAGAVTVDWVVLVAAVAGLGLATIKGVYPGADELACNFTNVAIMLARQERGEVPGC